MAVKVSEEHKVSGKSPFIDLRFFEKLATEL